MTNTTLNQNRTSLGFAPTLEGIWGSRQCAELLDPCEHLIFDWVHNTIQDGAFSHEFVAYMSNAEAVSREALGSFLDLGWQFPHSHKLARSSFKVLLATLEDGHLSGHNRPSATNVLTCSALLRFWICDHWVTPYKLSLESILDWIGLIQYAKYNEAKIRAEDAVAEVARCMVSTYTGYLDNAKRVHGVDFLSGKAHWNFHVIFQYLAKGRIYDTFNIERLHRRVKPFSRHVENPAIRANRDEQTCCTPVQRRLRSSTFRFGRENIANLRSCDGIA